VCDLKFQLEQQRFSPQFDLLIVEHLREQQRPLALRFIALSLLIKAQQKTTKNNKNRKLCCG